MTSDPRAALANLMTALERHLEASASKSGEDDPTVMAAYDDLADAFEAYDDALLQAYGEMTPMEIYEGAEDDGDEDEEDDEEDGGGGGESGGDLTDELDDHTQDEDAAGLYSGLDDDYDEDDEEER